MMSIPQYQSGIVGSSFPLVFNIVQIEQSHAGFPVSMVNVLDFLLWVRVSPNNDAKKRVPLMQYKASRHE